MRVKKGFINRNVCGESVLLATGQENIDFTNIISLNETADFLWKDLAKREAFTINDMVGLLVGEYEVDEAQAQADCRELIQQWTDAGILEGEDLPPVSPHVLEKAQEEEAAVAQEVAPKKEKKGFFSKLFKK